MSPARLKALRIVRDNPGISAADFAALMWPDSEGWNHPRKCGGYGTHRGGGMYVAGGQYLGKLKRAGLVERHFDQVPPGTTLTAKGAAHLRVAENLETRQPAPQGGDAK